MYETRILEHKTCTATQAPYQTIAQDPFIPSSIHYANDRDDNMTEFERPKEKIFGFSVVQC